MHHMIQNFLVRHKVRLRLLLLALQTALPLQLSWYTVWTVYSVQVYIWCLTYLQSENSETT